MIIGTGYVRVIIMPENMGKYTKTSDAMYRLFVI